MYVCVCQARAKGSDHIISLTVSLAIKRRDSSLLSGSENTPIISNIEKLTVNCRENIK